MGGGGGGHTTQTTTQELSPEQRELLKPVIPVAKEFVANPPQQYQGSAITPFNPLQQQAQQMTLGAAQQMVPYLNQLPGQTFGAIGGLGGTAQQAMNALQGVFPTLNPTMQWGANAAGQTAQQVGQGINYGNMQTQPGLNFLTNPANLMGNPYLAAATQAAIQPQIENFQNVILPSIATDAISAGGFGGTRQGIAEGLAAQGLQRQMGDIATNMYSQAYGQGLGAMGQGLNTQVNQNAQNLQAMVQSGQLTQQAANQIMQAQLGGFGAQQGMLGQAQQGLAGQIQGLGQVPDILQSGLLPAQLTASVGEQQQAMQQALLQEQVQKYINEQLIPFAAAQDVAALAFGVPAGTSRTEATTSGGSNMGGMMAMQALGGLLPLLFMSDRRLKENIIELGKLSDGLTVYSFNYKHSPLGSQIGLMADEVEKLYPEAVMRGDSGIAFVNYARVPSWQEI